MQPNTVNQPNKNGRTPFHVACRINNLPIMTEMLAFYPSFHPTPLLDNTTETATFETSCPYNLVNAVDDEGNTPMHLAIEELSYHEDLVIAVRLLLG
jgi:ankyrin repeat protein